jgi:Matrixin.
MRGAKFLTVIAVAATLTIGVRAYSVYAKWPSSSAGFYINPHNADVSDNAALTAVLNGAEVWETQSGALFDVLYNGQVSDTTTAYDNRNVVIFRNQSNGSTIGTTYSWYSGNTLVDADIIFWDGGFKFFTGSAGCSSGIYIEDVAAHEFGHALGLNHTSTAGATMYPSTQYCSQNWRTLAADDIAGVESLYPGGGPDPDPAPNTAPTVVISSPVTGVSFTKGTSISFAGSASDLQDGSLTSALSWTSNVDGQLGTGGSFSRVLSIGTHLISAGVTDSGKLSGSKLVTVTVDVRTGPTGSTATLTAKGYKSNGLPVVDLKWAGFSTGTVDIYRNGILLVTTANDGSLTNTITGSRGGSYVYKACSAGTSTCSNEALVSF